MLKEGLKVIIGNGARAGFWEDIRIDSSSLKESFPRIFALSSVKTGPVCS